MDAAGGLVDALYSRFLLRDIFGKVVPGALAGGAFAAGMFGAQEAFRTLHELPALAWPLVYGCAWLLGFAVQQIPESLRRSNTHGAKRYSGTPVTFHQHLRAARYRMAGDHDRQQLERFIVIKEASGNAMWAVLASPLVYFLGARPGLAESLQAVGPFVASNWMLVLAWAGLAGLLRNQHLSAIRNQDEYLDTVVSAADVPGASGIIASDSGGQAHRSPTGAG